MSCSQNSGMQGKGYSNWRVASQYSLMFLNTVHNNIGCTCSKIDGSFALYVVGNFVEI